MTGDTVCRYHSGPWIVVHMLGPARYPDGLPLVRCPETDFCLRGAQIIGGRIAFHFRNVPGPCPWVDLQVSGNLPLCGCEPHITTRQLRIVMRAHGQLRGPIRAVNCPGACTGLVSVVGGRIAEHRNGRCAWSGIRIIDKGWYPPILTPDTGDQ